MTNVNQSTTTTEPAPRRGSRHGFWFGLFAGGLFGMIVSGAVAVGAKAHFGHPRPGMFRHENPEEAREHMELMADWILSRVDATEKQKGEVNRVLFQAYQELLPIVEKHRQGHEALVAEMAKPELDPAAIERIRAEQIAFIDEASKELSGSLTELASVLTPEQRIELVELAQKFRH